MEIFTAIEASQLARAVRGGVWLYPLINTTHVLGVALLVGAITLVDLRLLGLVRSLGFSALSRLALPVAMIGFLLAAGSGLLLFVAEARELFANTTFLWKMGLVAVGGINALFFHLLLAAGSARWDAGTPPTGARVAGGASLALWVSVLVLGRMIAYT